MTRNGLQHYACAEATSLGRTHPEAPPRHRSEYQRDRDRIVHSAAFRRLEYKTQVFVNHEGDMFRTRLTHSIEVAQIGRTVARVLGLNEDLTEAVCLAHDLGHTPFGHAGQDALNAVMREHGGFEHNLQSLRVVDLLEERYGAFHGLNLTYETREGVLKHCSRVNAIALGPLGRRFLEGRHPSLEAQVANLADEIAYNNHDVDDGLRAGLISVEQLCQTTSFGQAHAEVLGLWPGLAERRVIHETVRRMIDRQVADLVQTTRERIDLLAPSDVESVRAAPGALVGFSDEGLERHRELKRFLREHLYRHYRVHRMTVKAARVVTELFNAFFDDARMLPDEARERVAALEAESGERGRGRGVADYVAGMTDRFAIAEYERVFDVSRLT
jgi:dGTPase